MLELDKVPIEGESAPTNLDHRQPSSSHHTTLENTPNNHLDNPLIPETTAENAPKTQMTVPPNNISVPPHQQKAQCNSLKGLPQFNSKQFGQGKCQQAPISRSNAAITDAKETFDVKEVIDVNKVINPKGIVLDKGGIVVDESKLAGEMETTLAISEDELSLREALNVKEK